MPSGPKRARSRSDEPQPSETAPLLPRTDFLLAGLFGVAVLVIVGVVVLLAGDEGEGGGGASPPTESPSGPGSPAPADSEAIEELARLSIEVLPRGEWASLYDSFSADFRARCPREQFDQLGLESARQLGPDLALLAFKRLEQLAVDGDSATAVIIGELRGKSEYSIRAAFQREGGEWKITPVQGAAGCSAFDRLSG